MRIISYNVNGIRSAINKGFIDWLKTKPADVVCLQETKALEQNVSSELFKEAGYKGWWFSAQKKGYSGVAVFSMIEPDNVEYGNGDAVSDDEGRIIQLDFGDTRLINAYFPSGTSGEIRQAIKYQWLDDMYAYLKKLRKKHPKIILCGDYNIAHKEIDVHNPKKNKNITGFLPKEREWLDKLFKSGWIDVFREFHPEPERYTWWNTFRPSTREENKGWRIDYISVTEPLKNNLVGAEIYPGVKHSDHCPVFAEINL